MRQCSATIAITHSPNTGRIRLQLVVNGDVVPLVGRDAGPIKTQIARVGSTPYRSQHVSSQHFRRTVITFNAYGKYFWPLQG